MKYTYRPPNVDALKGHHGSKPTYCGHNVERLTTKRMSAYGLKCSICCKLHHFTKVCCNKKSLPRQKSSTKPQRTSHKGDYDSWTDTKSKRKIHKVQDTDHSSQSDPHSNKNIDLYQSSDEFFLSPLQIVKVSRSPQHGSLKFLLMKTVTNSLQNWTLEQKWVYYHCICTISYKFNLHSKPQPWNQFPMVILLLNPLVHV